MALSAPEGFRYSYPHYFRPLRFSDSVPVYYRSDWDPADGFVGEPGLDGLVTRGEFGAMTATSSSTPVVAGTAAVFKSFYLSEKSNLIDDPGIMYTNLLLMGDRFDQNGTFLENAHDSRYGAGRLRARKWDDQGLDAPARWSTGSTCVDDGVEVLLPINPDGSGVAQPLNGFDYIKVAMWMYDSDFDQGGMLSSVIAELQAGPLFWVTRVQSDTSDNKRLIYEDDNLQGVTFRLRFFGLQADEDLAGCGTDSARVYWAILLEDNDRNDADLPTCVDPEN